MKFYLCGQELDVDRWHTKRNKVILEKIKSLRKKYGVKVILGEGEIISFNGYEIFPKELYISNDEGKFSFYDTVDDDWRAFILKGSKMKLDNKYFKISKTGYINSMLNSNELMKIDDYDYDDYSQSTFPF